MSLKAEFEFVLASLFRGFFQATDVLALVMPFCKSGATTPSSLSIVKNEMMTNTRPDISNQIEKVWQPRYSGTSCRKEVMVVINTFQGGEATFASTRGAVTRIDCIAAPAEMLARLNLFRIRLQLTRSTRGHDHSLVIAVCQKQRKKKREKSQRGLQRP